MCSAAVQLKFQNKNRKIPTSTSAHAELTFIKELLRVKLAVAATNSLGLIVLKCFITLQTPKSKNSRRFGPIHIIFIFSVRHYRNSLPATLCAASILFTFCDVNMVDLACEPRELSLSAFWTLSCLLPLLDLIQRDRERQIVMTI